MITIPGAEKSLANILAYWHPSAGSPRLVSLWEMLKLHAADFYTLTASLVEVRHNITPATELISPEDIWAAIREILVLK